MSSNRYLFITFAFLIALPTACRSVNDSSTPGPDEEARAPADQAAGTAPAVESGDVPEDRVYLIERVDDVAIVQLYADGFNRLTLKDKRLVWHLYQAAVAGRDIFIAQKCEQGLEIRDLLEEIITHPAKVDPARLAAIRRYTKLFWVNNSPYNAITSRKNVMRLTEEALTQAAAAAQESGAKLPTRAGESVKDLVARLAPMLFDPDYMPMVTTKNPEGGQDILSASAVTFYGEGVTLRDLEGFEEAYELNSTVVKGAGGKLKEIVWRAGDAARAIPAGLYAEEIERIVTHLENARKFAPAATAEALTALVRAYRSGSVEDLRAYDLA